MSYRSDHSGVLCGLFNLFSLSMYLTVLFSSCGDVQGLPFNNSIQMFPQRTSLKLRLGKADFPTVTHLLPTPNTDCTHTLKHTTLTPISPPYYMCVRTCYTCACTRIWRTIRSHMRTLYLEKCKWLPLD